MIQLIPVEKGERLDALLKQHHLEYEEKIHAYAGIGENAGVYCVFSLEKHQVHLLAIECGGSSDPLLPELLVRAVAAYAANRSGYLFSVDESIGNTIEPTLKTLRFEKAHGAYIGKVPSILQGTCHCLKN